MVQLSWRITRRELLGSLKAEGVSFNVIKVVVRLFLGVKAVQKPNRPIFPVGLGRCFQSGDLNARIGSFQLAPMNGKGDKVASKVAVNFVEEEEAAYR